MGKAKITINGKTYEAPEGSSLSVLNGVMYIDGAKVEEGLDKWPQPVQLEIKGKLEHLDTTASVVVHGNVLGSIQARGSVQCGDVKGSRGVEADGSVQCGNVGGSVDAGGSVSCGRVSGSVDAGGSVNCRS